MYMQLCMIIIEKLFTKLLVANLSFFCLLLQGKSLHRRQGFIRITYIYEDEAFNDHPTFEANSKKTENCFLVSILLSGNSIIVSTGSIRWILSFSVRYAGAACREIFGVNALKRKTTVLRFTKFAGYLHWGVSFSGKENSLILKNKMAATGISLKIIDIFLLAVSHR